MLLLRQRKNTPKNNTFTAFVLDMLKNLKDMYQIEHFPKTLTLSFFLREREREREGELIEVTKGLECRVINSALKLNVPILT